MGDKFTDIERAVITLELEGNHDERLIKLRKQFETSAVAQREMTGVGFFTEIKVLDSPSYLLDSENFEIGDVSGKTAEVTNGVGFVLFVRDGVLSMLEGYTHGDDLWPAEGTAISLSNQKTGREKTIQL